MEYINKDESTIYWMQDAVLVYGLDMNVYCKKYTLYPYVVECSDCDKDIHINIPYITKDKEHGLCGKLCSCGSENSPFTYSSKDL